MQRTVEMGSRKTSNGDGGSWVSMALETVLAFAGVVTMVLALRLVGPTVVWFLAAEVPRAYASALAWLRPPYIYLVINGIIITIAASSRFQKHPAADPSTLPVMNLAEVQREMKLAEDEPRRELSSRAKAEPEVEVEVEEEFVISTSSWSPKRRRGSLAEMPTEYSVAAEAKPLLSTRFGHPKAAEPSADGKALGLARRNETLESTWRTITERRARPVKKSDTWDTRSGVCREEPAAAMRKSETLIEAAGAGAASRERPRREASKGQEELNRRVEAFIRKFNQEMRLQRQESLKHHMEMINRGNH
ncbi:uncharacterized protein LOC103978415 [Musa acuminata AAA Group]|uniref:uncharacterized protein LOC103978415 n=1 Tax=Musa acuminata AAA Group TaxID=214697 RepID=UPI0031D207F1